MKKFVVFLVALLILAMPGIAIAQESVDGVIEGQVLNGTSGGGNVTALDVTLTPFVGEEIQETETTKTNSQGKFQFSSLSTDPDHVYFVSVHYLGVNYPSDLLFWGANETSKSIEITVFDTITSDDFIRINLAHPIIGVEDDGLLVNEYFQFTNEGNRTYIGSQDPTAHEHMGTLSFSLPPGALVIEADQGLIQAGNNIIHALPVLPGIGEAGYSYSIPRTESGNYIFPVEINYPTDKLNIMVRGGDIEITCAQLSQSTISMGEQQVIQLTGYDFPRGTTFDVSISVVSGGGIGTPLIVGIALAVVVLGIIIYFLMRRNTSQTASDDADDIESQKQRLLHEIASLDDDFEEGKIAEDVYQQKRSEKKAQLLALSKQRDV